jgi:formylglycine-generating enzyme required for sulfatase activity
VEAGLGRSTAVGLYPAGESAYELQDMAGMLYEWCWNRFDDPNALDYSDDRDIYRAIGGGTMNYDWKPARCAARFRLHPFFSSTRQDSVLFVCLAIRDSGLIKSGFEN